MKSKTVTTYCSSCNLDTRQIVLHCRRVLGELESDGRKKESVDLEELYMIIRCAGCHSTSFLKRTTFPDIDDDGRPVSFDENFPGDESEFNFLSDDDLAMLPASLRKVYFEIMSSFCEGSEILSGVGLRLILEAICINQKIPGNTLSARIIVLKDKGFISANEYPILDKLRLIGNVAAHQIKGLRIEILAYALDIINHVLRSIYILPKINKRIKIR